MVLAWHAPIDRALVKGVAPFLSFVGFAGVELFFVLSGFLIGNILLLEFADYQGFRTIRDFWARRWLRTLPALYLYLAVYVVWSRCTSGQLPAMTSYLVFLQNFAWRMPDFFGQSWSLAIEEWFYLAFPLLGLAFTKVLPRRKSVLAAAITLGLGSIAARLFFSHSFPEWDWRYDLRKVCILRFDALALGVLLAYLKQSHVGVYSLLSRWRVAILGCLVLVGTSLLPESAHHPLLETAVLLMCPVGFALILPAAATLRPRPGFGPTAVTMISNWSYSIYLSNNLISELVSSRTWVKLVPSGPLVTPMVFLVLTLAISWFTYTFVEKPVLRYRDSRFPARAEREGLPDARARSAA